jgi:cysteine desulfurase/selenocysteine lyase
LVTPAVDADSIRSQFPILRESIRGHRLTYLDNAATSLKPQCVIDSIVDTLSRNSANIHRGVHLLSQRATQRYERARDVIQSYLGAAHRSEIIFVRGATEAINLVANSWGKKNLSPGDEIVITGLEHHANIVPWQMLRDLTGATLKVIPIDDDGEVQLSAVEEVLSPKTRILALAHVSNSLGTVLPVKEIIKRARAVGAKVLVDGAQAVAHMPVNVQELGADFYTFSGHKLYGPDGIGVLYGRRELLESMEPYQTGGDMIRHVTFEKTTFSELPHRFEAGTPNISGAIALGRAIEFVQSVGFSWIVEHEQHLLSVGVRALQSLSGVKLVGMPAQRSGVISFTVDGVHPHDLGTFLDTMGIAIRTGHHCAQPVMDRMGIAATARASLGMFNTPEDLSLLVDGIRKAQEMFV